MDDKQKAREVFIQSEMELQAKYAKAAGLPFLGSAKRDFKNGLQRGYDAGYAAASAQPATEPDKRKLMITNKPLKEFVPEVTIVYSDGTWKSVLASQAWEYENDPDYLVTIPPFTPKETTV